MGFNTLARLFFAIALVFPSVSFVYATTFEAAPLAFAKRSSSSVCQNKSPPPAGGVCTVRGTVKSPATLQNSLASSATTYAECQDRCYSVNNCQSFSFRTKPQTPQCIFYRKAVRRMGWHADRSAATIFDDRACLKCNCNATLQNGNWESGKTSPWSLSGYDGYVTNIASPGADGSKYALKTVPPLGNADFPGSSYISQQFAWCAFRNYTISFMYKMAVQGYSTIEMYSGDINHQYLAFSAANDGSRAWETVSVTFNANSDNGWIQFQFDSYQVKQVFRIDNIVITPQ